MVELALSWDWGAFLLGLIAGCLLAPAFLALLSRAAPDREDRFR